MFTLAASAGKLIWARRIRLYTPFAEQGFVSVLLNKTLRSSTLRLACIYVIVFSLGIFGVMAYVYWSAVDYVSDKSDSNVEIECNLLIQTFNRFGRGGV